MTKLAWIGNVRSMNKLPVTKRAQILGMLCEGMSMRATSRLADVSINTVTKLLLDVGQAASDFQDKTLRNLNCKRVFKTRRGATDSVALIMEPRGTDTSSDEIEVTPEMIEAGSGELAWFSPRDDGDLARAEVLAEIYRAMEKVRRRQVS